MFKYLTKRILKLKLVLVLSVKHLHSWLISPHLSGQKLSHTAASGLDRSDSKSIIKLITYFTISFWYFSNQRNMRHMLRKVCMVLLLHNNKCLQYSWICSRYAWPHTYIFYVNMLCVHDMEELRNLTSILCISMNTRDILKGIHSWTAWQVTRLLKSLLILCTYILLYYCLNVQSIIQNQKHHILNNTELPFTSHFIQRSP